MIFDLEEVQNVCYTLEKKFEDSLRFEKDMGLRKKLISDFCEIANRWGFLFHPLCFRLKWVKSGKKREKFFFFLFRLWDTC